MHPVVGPNGAVVAKQEIPGLASTEMAARMASWTEEEWRELVLQELGVLGNLENFYYFKK